MWGQTTKKHFNKDIQQLSCPSSLLHFSDKQSQHEYDQDHDHDQWSLTLSLQKLPRLPNTPKNDQTSTKGSWLGCVSLILVLVFVQCVLILVLSWTMTHGEPPNLGKASGLSKMGQWRFSNEWNHKFLGSLCSIETEWQLSDWDNWSWYWYLRIWLRLVCSF